VNVQLSYGASTVPFPLQASPDSGALSVYSLTVTASNPAEDPDANPVTLEGVQITLPLGEAGSQLTSDPGDIAPVAPPDWQLQTGTDVGVFAFVPTAGSVQVTGQSIPFVLDQLKVNRQPGNVEGLQVAEGTGGCQPPDCPTTDLALTKFPYGWGQVDFWVQPPDIPANASTTLNWDGPEGATYEIEYGTRTGVVNIPASNQPPLGSQGVYPGQGQPPLTLANTTVFTLTVTGTISGTNYTAQQQKTVTVQQAIPTISKYTGQVAYRGDDTYRLTFKWTTNAKYCQIPEASADLLGGSSTLPADPVDVTAPSAGTFDLQASNDAGTSTSTLTLAWAAAAEITLPPGTSTESPIAVAISPDGTRLYALVNAKEGAQGATLTVFHLPDDPTAQPTQLSTWPAPQWTELKAVTAVAAGAQDLVWVLALAYYTGLSLQYIPLLVSPDGTIQSGGPTTTEAAGSGAGPYHLAAAPGGSQLCCADGLGADPLHGKLWGYAVGSDRSLSPIGNVELGQFAMGAAVATDGTVYSTSLGFVFHYALSGGGFTLLAQQQLSDPIHDVAVAGDALFAAGDSDVLVLDRTSLQPVRPPLTLVGETLAAASNGMRLYASTSLDTTVTVFTPSALTGGVPG
jgi:hypothetical protein